MCAPWPMRSGRARLVVPLKPMRGPISVRNWPARATHRSRRSRSRRSMSRSPFACTAGSARAVSAWPPALRVEAVALDPGRAAMGQSRAQHHRPALGNALAAIGDLLRRHPERAPDRRDVAQPLVDHLTQVGQGLTGLARFAKGRAGKGEGDGEQPLLWTTRRPACSDLQQIVQAVLLRRLPALLPVEQPACAGDERAGGEAEPRAG
jgi:hypothetical protein